MPVKPKTPEIRWVELNPPERTRFYVFPGGERLEFDEVSKIQVLPDGSHRLETSGGQKAIISTGWICLAIDADAWVL